MTTEASNLNNSNPEQAPPPLNELYVIPSPDIFSFMYLNDLYQQLIDSTTTSLRTENPLEPRDGVITREEFVQHYGDNYKFNNRDIFRVTNIGGIIYYANVRSLTNPCFVDTGLLLFPGGVSYDGSFYLGKPHYYGKLTYSNGDEYSGQFKNGFLEGEGLYHYKSHDRWKSYSGWWLRGKRQGGGKLLYRNGMIELKEYSYDVEIASITPDRIMEENMTINQWLLERRPTIFQNSEPASSIPSSFQSLDITPQQSSLPSPPHSPPPQSSPPQSSPPQSPPPLSHPQSPLFAPLSPPGSPNSPPVSSHSPLSLPPENYHYSPPSSPLPPRSPLSSPRQSANISSRSNLDQDVNRMREILETLEKFENEELSTTSESLQSTVSSLNSTSSNSTITSNVNLKQKLQEQKILINHYRQNSYKTEQKNIKKIKSLQRYSTKLRDEREELKDKITNYQNTVITCNETLQEAVQSIHQKNRQIQQLQTANTDLSNNITSLTRNRNSEGNNLCKLCLSSIRTVVLIPCKHLSMCRNCERRNSIHHIDNDTYQPLCPICRTPYTDTLNIFNS